MKLVIQVFNAAVAVLLVAVPPAAEAQRKEQAVHTVGILMPQRPEHTHGYPAFLETLRRLGYREDGNLRILLRSADGNLGQQHAFQTGSAELAARHRLPLMVGLRQNVEAGGLISYTADTDEVYRRTAVYVDRILKGSKPGDLPEEQPTKFELAINLKTVKTLGLAIPQSVLLQASHVVK